jgi:hypothetical protein
MDLLVGFHARRLEALEHIARDFAGNRQTEKRAFDLPDLRTFAEKARSLAQALDEFVTIERHVALSDWKRARLAPPERRVLAGESLLVRYREEGQEQGVAARNRENRRRQALWVEYEETFRAAHPEATRVQLAKDQRAETAWSPEGLRIRLRLDASGVDCTLDEALALLTLREGDRIVINPRTTVDTRLPAADQTPFTPTPRQMLYAPRGTIARIVATAYDDDGHVTAAVLDLTLARPGGSDKRGFAFGSYPATFEDGLLYTLDADPNDWYGAFCATVVEGLCAGEHNTLHERLVDPSSAHVTWPATAVAAQERFLAGLDALHAADSALVGLFEPSKRAYIGGHGQAPTLLVQGPPGTGKSYATAFALFARLQGAMAADVAYRAFIACKTHAATDVLLDKALGVHRLLRRVSEEHSALFAAYFDARLLDVPLFRVRPRQTPPDGIVALPRDDERPTGAAPAVDRITAVRWCVVATPPAGIRGIIKDRWPKALFGHDLADALILDEASQLNLPEAAMAALPLTRDGHLIVVGDHRQMPPIVKHDWATEPRRTFLEYRSYESLFQTLLPLGPALIQFEESFRLHEDMAEFLRREVYVQDGIRYHSHRHDTLPALAHPDPFVAAILSPEHPLVVVVHDEAHSQARNPFEQDLVAPVLEALADPAWYGYGPKDGLGVVVPHRAQRAALQAALPQLTVRDEETGAITLSAVDTVERFQGDERTVIMVSATESDLDYLLMTGDFLLDPRRLTVALSRATSKMILVASRSVFSLFSADEDTFAHAQLWKNLLRHTCTIPLWTGQRDGEHVEVWGNTPTQAAKLDVAALEERHALIGIG